MNVCANCQSENPISSLLHVAVCCDAPMIAESDKVNRKSFNVKGRANNGDGNHFLNFVPAELQAEYTDEGFSAIDSEALPDFVEELRYAGYQVEQVIE